MKYIITQDDVGRDIDDIIKGLKKPKKEVFDPVNMVMPLAINTGSWSEWCQFRKEKKKPISKMAANKALNLLVKYSALDQESIINKSIQNDYQGLFELSVINQPRKTLYEQLNDTSWASEIEIAE